MTQSDDDNDEYMTAKHRALLREYVDELRKAKKLAEAWWKKLVGDETDESSPATAEIRRRWPNGPVSHPYVIGTIVKYAKACDDINRTLKARDEVPVNQFVIDALDSSDTRDLARFTNGLSYWPLGVDKDRRAV